MDESLEQKSEQQAPASYGIRLMFSDPTRSNPICLGTVSWPDKTFRQTQWNKIVMQKGLMYSRFTALLLGPDDSTFAVIEVAAEVVEVLLEKPISVLMLSARENTVLQAQDLKHPTMVNRPSYRAHRQSRDR